jgi:hypothetical protein
MPEIQALSEPWDRQPGEPNRWYNRYERYRLAGAGRSLLAIYNDERQRAGKGERATRVPGAWDRAASRWCWRERAVAWDEHERQKARDAHARDIAEMRSRHIQEAIALQAKAVERLKSLDLKDLSPGDVARFFTEATKLERIARGEPESIEERRLTGTGGGPVKFSLEDAVRADKELEYWQNDRVQPSRGGTLLEGNPQVP